MSYIRDSTIINITTTIYYQIAATTRRWRGWQNGANSLVTKRPKGRRSQAKLVACDRMRRRMHARARQATQEEGSRRGKAALKVSKSGASFTLYLHIYISPA